MGPILTIVLTAIAFVVMILLLATTNGKAGKATGILVAIVALGGLLMYGYGFATTIDYLPMAVIRSLMAACGMFLGRNELSAVAAAPLLQPRWVQLLGWILHLLAMYITAGAAIVAVGTRVLKQIHLWLARRGQMNVIYGVNEDSLSLGKQLNSAKTQAVVLVGDASAASFSGAAAAAGCVLRLDTDAQAGNVKFLNAIGMNRGKRSLTVYALSKDATANLRYAQRLLKSLEAKKIGAEQTRLVILCPEDRAVSQLQVQGNTYGYGYVAAVNEAGLTARLLVRSFPPYEQLTFDADARARENFEALIVGFGQTGQAVLGQLLINGQFEGSTFRATVFDLEYDRAGGYFADANSQILDHYDIQFVNADGRSAQMYQFLHSRGDALKYVVVCTGNEKVNHEIAQDLCHYFLQVGRSVPVYQCSRWGVRSMDADGLVRAGHRIYTAQLLGQEQLDNQAMILNAHYMDDGSKTPLEHWMNCDYFSRQSSRASADFVKAMEFAAGKGPGDPWELTEQQLLNLSKTEHHRWCAFHYCMGYRTMSDQEFDRRAREYRRQLREEGRATIRIAKNTRDRTHACLVSWEALNDLSEKEKAVTGKDPQYQQKDIENVQAVPELLRIT